MPLPTIPPIEPPWIESVEPLFYTFPSEETMEETVEESTAPDAIDRMKRNRELGPHRKLLKKFKRSHKSGLHKKGNRTRMMSPLEAYVFDGRVLSAINRNRPPKKPLVPQKKSRPITHDFDKRAYKGWSHKHHTASHKAHHSTAEKIRDKYHDGEKWRTQLHKHAYENHKRLVNFHKHMARTKRGLKKEADSNMSPEEYRRRYGRSKP